MEDGRLDRDQRLTEALVTLLAHDLRTPLGPLALAVSTIAQDETVPEAVRDMARVAEVQTARVGRLIDSAVAAMRGARRVGGRTADLGAIVREAAAAFEDLGGRCAVRTEPCRVVADSGSLRDALAGLMECAAGEGGSVEVVVHAEAATARITIRGPEVGGAMLALAEGCRSGGGPPSRSAPRRCSARIAVSCPSVRAAWSPPSRSNTRRRAARRPAGPAR